MNASYSDSGYALSLGGNQKQMFLCQVALGDVVQLDPNNELRIPPLKPGSTSERYDSVGGVTGGSQIYVCKSQVFTIVPNSHFVLHFAVYGDGRAYPKYLVTYSHA